MKKYLFALAGLLALGCLGYFGTWVSAQNGTPAPPPAAKPTLKIGVVNIAKVLKNFEKANYLGETLLKDAQAKEEYVKKQAMLLEGENQKATIEPDKAKQEAMMKDIRNRDAQLKEQTIEYKKVFTEKQGEMAVSVNSEINRVIDSVAKTYGLELVLTYPDVVDEAERGKTPDAFRRLSTPAAMVAWVNPGLDLTDTVIATLNKYFPKPAGVTQTSGVSGAANK